MQPEIVCLCDNCAALVPVEDTSMVTSKPLGTLKSIGSLAESCRLCELIWSGRIKFIQDIHKKYPDIDDTTIDDLPLSASAEPCQKSEEGLVWSQLSIRLSIREFVFNQFYFIMACDPHGTLFP
jgi:hypothetical protein